MNDTMLLPEDPKLTAYALGELDAAEHAEVEAAVRADPALQAAVAEIRALTGQLSTVLAHEPLAAPLTQETTMTPVVKRKRGTLLKFPQLYFVIGGLAAACFAVVLAVKNEELQKREAEYARQVKHERAKRMEYEAMAKARQTPASNMQLQAVGALQPLQGPMPAPESAGNDRFASERAYSATSGGADKVATTAGVVATTEGETKILRRRQLAELPARPNLVATGGSADEGVVTLSPFTVTDEKDNGYLRTNTVAATRLNAPVRDIPMSVSGMSKEFIDGANIRSTADALRYASSSQAPAAALQGRGSPGGTVIPGLNSGGYPAGPATVIGGKDAEQSKRDALQATLRGLANTEAYAFKQENAFLGAEQNPLSTFSIDVDTAGYANVRRFLNAGERPPADAVRIEELVNYFPYHYAAPVKTDVPFAASMEVASAPWAPEHRLVRIGLKGREVTAAQRGAANLVFLLDVSGSMNQPNKLPLVKESMKLLVGKLRPDDHVAIVVYAGASGLALPSTSVAKSADILAAIDELRAGGSTNGAMGIQLAYDIAKANFVSDGINRVILCTDGDFNVGVTGEGDLTRLIEEKAKSKVFLTVLGFGMGNLKDATMEMLADKGNGNYGYIDSKREAQKLLVEQVSGTLVTIAKDVKLQVEFNPAQVASYRLIGYENRLLKKEDFNNDKVDAGEIGAGHTVTALYEVVPVGSADATATQGSVDELKYKKTDAGRRKALAETNPVMQEMLTLKVRYKEPTGDVSKKLEFALTDGGAKFEQASADFQFAAAVAEFGMILRGSSHKGSGTLGQVAAWAKAATADDIGGYRGEFIGLVEKAEALQ